MNKLLASLITAAGLACTPLLHAQEPAPPAQPPAPGIGQQQPAADVSDDDLETFADIYIELEDTLGRYEQELASADSEEDAQQVQMQMQQESFDKIAEHGWTPDQYNRVVQAVNADPNLLQKAVALIEERS